MLRTPLWAGLLLAALPAAAQRPEVTKVTIFRDTAGQVLTKDEYKRKLRTGRFFTDNAQITNGIITSLSLKKAGSPDAVRAQALAPQRAFGTEAPAFSGTDVYGQSVTLAALRGRVVVVNFWFIKCPYCVQEIPSLRQLTNTYREQADVVFVSFALDGPEALRKFLASHGDFGFRVLPEARETARQFGVSAYPTTVVIDKAGRFVFDQYYSDSSARLDEAIRRARQ